MEHPDHIPPLPGSDHIPALPVQRLIDLNPPSMSSYDRQLVMREFYESHYRIFDHDTWSKDRPLAVVAEHAKEDANIYSAYYQTMHRYVKARIKEIFGLSLVDFLNQPHDVVEYQFALAASTAVKEQADTQRQIQQLEQMQSAGSTDPSGS